MPLQIRRGTELERGALTSLNGLVVGELLYTTDSQKLYVGNGAAPGGVAATSYNDNDAKAAAGSAITSGTHQYINFTYNPSTRTISSTLDLSDYQGSIRASSLKGSLLADDGSSLGGITLVDATNGSVNLNGTVKGNIVPDLNITYDIGTSLLRFRDLYLSGTSIHLGNAIITAEIDGTLNLPSIDVTGGITGDVLGNVTGDVLGNVTGDVLGNVTGNLLGNVTGDVLGNVTGDVLGNVTGDVLGNVTGDLSGSVFGQNSAVIVDATNNSITATEVLTNSIISDTNSISVNSSDNTGLEIDFFVNDFGLGVTGISNGPQAGPAVQYRSSRGTFNLPTALQSTDAIGLTTYFGHNGTEYQVASLIGSFVDPNGTLTGGQVPSLLGLTVFPDNNPLNPKIVTINRNGYVSIGYSLLNDAAAHLDINGAMRLAPLSSAPTNPVSGMLAVADGTGWNPTSTGKNTLVCYLGSAWVQVAVAP